VTEPSNDPCEWQQELATEGARLLNPYFDDPEDHFVFEPTTGAMVPIDDRGRATVEICDLNRPSLCEIRLELRKNTLLGMVFAAMDNDLDCVVPPETEFSYWCRCLLKHKLADMARRSGLVVTESARATGP
jgi:hypothetical protein